MGGADESVRAAFISWKCVVCRYSVLYEQSLNDDRVIMMFCVREAKLRPFLTRLVNARYKSWLESIRDYCR